MLRPRDGGASSAELKERENRQTNKITAAMTGSGKICVFGREARGESRVATLVAVSIPAAIYCAAG